MANENTNTVDKTWIGGFEDTNAAFPYPKPKLKSLPMLDNLANIALLQRQMGVKWPEFSWETVVGDPNSRCYQMFSPYVSRIGYDRTGRVYSIICPQQGMWLGDKVCINVEVTVTGQRGWVNETTKELAADMTVEAKIWLSPKQGEAGKLIWLLLQTFDDDFPFPIDKEHAIRVVTHKPGDPEQPIFPLVHNITDKFEIPDFAKHPEAFTVAHLGVKIAEPKLTHQPLVDEFNKLLMKAFNLASGNMLVSGNTLSWNVWFTPPEVVNQKEWKDHAEVWRTSIEAHHGAPTGDGSTPKYFNGEPFQVREGVREEVSKDMMGFLLKNKNILTSETVEKEAMKLLAENGVELKDVSDKAKEIYNSLFGE